MHQPIAQLHLSVYKAHATHNYSIRSDEGLTLETSAFESGSLRWPIYIISPFDKTKLSCNTLYRRNTAVSFETYPLYMKMYRFVQESRHAIERKFNKSLRLY